MPNHDVGALTTLGVPVANGGRSSVSFLDDRTLVYSSGNGLVVQDIESGSQVRGDMGALAIVLWFAVCCRLVKCCICRPMLASMRW